MRPRSVLAVVLLVTLFASVSLPVVAAGAGGDAAGTDVPGVAAGTDAVGPVVAPNFTRADPATVITIDVTDRGHARWTVASRFRLENETQVAAFEAMAADVRNGTGPAGTLGYSVGTFRRFADEAAATTPREDPMRVEDADWRARVDPENDTGVLALSFTWTNFADRQDGGNRIVLGDVFDPEDGDGWFPALGTDQRLVINAPPDYLVRENTLPYPIREGGSIHIDGPENLTAQEVSVVYGPADDGSTTNGTPTATPTPTPTRTTDPGQGIPQGLVGGGLLALAVVAVLVGYLLYDRADDDGPDPGTGPAGGEDGTGAAADPPDASADPATGDGGTTAGVEDGSPGPAPEGTDGATAATGATGDDGATASDEATADAGATGDEEAAGDGATGGAAVDPELLSDEERVERLLRENGGRMKQSNIVTETGWSNAKVSQLLSAMDEDDRIDKLRIGRENLIALPEEDVGEIE